MAKSHKAGAKQPSEFKDAFNENKSLSHFDLIAIFMKVWIDKHHPLSHFYGYIWSLPVKSNIFPIT